MTNRLSTMLGLSLVVAVLSAILGHLSARILPPLVFGWLGYPHVGSAETAGMTAVASGGLFLLALLFARDQGLVVKAVRRWLMTFEIARQDILGLLYRAEEAPIRRPVAETVSEIRGAHPWLVRWVLRSLVARGQIVSAEAGYKLTDQGRAEAAQLVRGHRLWESFMSLHFHLPDDHLHASAERVEHFLDPNLQAELSNELHAPQTDPHGRQIPPVDGTAPP